MERKVEIVLKLSFLKAYKPQQGDDLSQRQKQEDPGQGGGEEQGLVGELSSKLAGGRPALREDTV